MPEERNANSDTESTPARRPRQFSLRRLLAWMVAWSLTFGLGRLIGAHGGSAMTIVVLTMVLIEAAPATRRVMMAVLVCVYLPTTLWLVSGRFQVLVMWLKICPVIPGLAVIKLMPQVDESTQLLICGGVSLALIALATILAQDKRFRAFVLLAVFILSAFNSMMIVVAATMVY